MNPKREVTQIHMWKSLWIVATSSVNVSFSRHCNLFHPLYPNIIYPLTPSWFRTYDLAYKDILFHNHIESYIHFLITVALVFVTRGMPANKRPLLYIIICFCMSDTSWCPREATSWIYKLSIQSVMSYSGMGFDILIFFFNLVTERHAGKCELGI